MILIYQKVGYLPCEVFETKQKKDEYLQSQGTDPSYYTETTIASSGLIGCFLTEDLETAKEKLKEMQEKYPDKKIILGTYTQTIEVPQ